VIERGRKEKDNAEAQRFAEKSEEEDLTQRTQREEPRESRD
jgi:hypothetical protein